MAVLWNYLDRFAPQLALRFMMNRRNIRIKVMQVLYMIETEVQIAPKALLQKEFDKTRNLFVFLVHLLHQVALYAEVEANQRASKNLPNQEDLTVNTKLAGNLLVWQTLESESFKNALELVKPAQYLDDQIVKSIFRQLSDTDIKAYLEKEQPYDCAGSFKSEGLGISLFDQIKTNDPTCLIGLPLILVRKMLSNQEINI